jgi:hypothetical protein
MLTRTEKKALMIVSLITNGLVSYALFRTFNLHSSFPLKTFFNDSIGIVPGTNNIGVIYFPLDLLPVIMLIILLILIAVGYLMIKSLIILIMRARSQVNKK